MFALAVFSGCHSPRITVRCGPMMDPLFPSIFNEPAMYDVYFGTYTKECEEGVFHATLDTQTGELEMVGGAMGVVNPSFLAKHPSKPFLYAACEAEDGGGAAVFSIDAETGSLTHVDLESSGGQGACHITVDPAGTTALVANYGGGSVASFPILDDGTLGPATSVIQHEGSSIDPDRQQAPHVHSVTVDPSGKFVVVADLGTDELRVYRLNVETGELTPHDPPATKLHPGAGPRHFAFHPNGRAAYVINELNATVSVLRWDADAATLTEVQTISTLPPEWEGRRSTAEVVVHPNGKFLYGSNRGQDTIVIYAIGDHGLSLKSIDHVATPGAEPRNFNLDPTGRWMITCHQNSDTVQVYRVDEASGGLLPVGEPVAVPMPVCVKFVSRG